MYLNPWRFTVFCTNGVRNVKYMCSGFLCCVCVLTCLSSWLC